MPGDSDQKRSGANDSVVLRADHPKANKRSTLARDNPLLATRKYMEVVLPLTSMHVHRRRNRHRL
jgi:hypothetical protein